jgi:GNAT superfamily N-acetyltransferase
MEPHYVTVTTSDYTLIAALDDRDTTIGHVAVRKQEGIYGTRRYAEICALHVRESARRNGIGSELVRRARDWARERGYSHISVTSGAKNNDAIKFYGHCGFTPRSVVLDHEL